MLNFLRQAHNEKVTDCHALFRILWFFELGCFLGRNIDLGGSFPTHDLKFGQFCNSTKNFGRPKFCWNFSEIFRFFFEQFWKKYYFPGSFFTENFAKWLWILAIFHKPLVYEGLWKIAKTWKKMSFKGLEKRARIFSPYVAILRCWRGCEWRWIWIEMILWLCGINVFFYFTNH